MPGEGETPSEVDDKRMRTGQQRHIDKSETWTTKKDRCFFCETKMKRLHPSAPVRSSMGTTTMPNAVDAATMPHGTGT